jgi:hypothetical protein
LRESVDRDQQDVAFCEKPLPLSADSYIHASQAPPNHANLTATLRKGQCAMTSIKGPTGPILVDASAVSGTAPQAAERSHGPAFAAHVEAARAQSAAGADYVQQLASEVSAGRMSPTEAVDVLVEAAAGPDLPDVQRAELRSLLTDIIANDPHFASLIASMG